MELFLHKQQCIHPPSICLQRLLQVFVVVNLERGNSHSEISPGMHPDVGFPIRKVGRTSPTLNLKIQDGCSMLQ